MSDKTFGTFTSKQAEVEAYQFNNFCGSRGERPRWLIEAVEAGKVWYQGGERPYLTVATSIGHVRAQLGDWIVREWTGALFVSEPEAFAATFDPTPSQEGQPS